MFKIKDKTFLSYYQEVKKSFPSVKNRVRTEEDYNVPMRDGIKLKTRVFKPNIDGPYNVLFTRNPYPANTDLNEALYVPLVEQGYCLIIQDCRGTGDSEGNWQPFENERNDGIDSLIWLNNQDWIKAIATFGRSYSAYTQWIVGDHLPNKVKTMFLEVYGVNRFDQVYSNGMFREDIYTSWAFQNSLVKSTIPAGKQYQEALQIYPAVNRDRTILNTRLGFYQDYLTHTNKNEPYWKDSIWNILEQIPPKINIPVVVTDGWADHHLQGSLLGFYNLKPEIRNKSRLIITPTDHMSQTTGNISYPNFDKYGAFNMKAYLIWFNHILKNDEKSLQSEWYQMGTGKWISLTDINKTKPLKLYLNGSNQLVDKVTSEATVKFDYDPTQPNTWPGGNELLAWITPGFTNRPHGFVKTQAYKNKNDVIKFVSRPFDNGLEILGRMKIQLKVDTTVRDTSFAVRLVEETAEGQYINLKDGISSLSQNAGQKASPHKMGKPVIIKLDLGDIAWKLKNGSKLVLLISSSNFPMYAIHANRYGLWSKQIIDQVIAHQVVYVDSSSFLTISIYDRKDVKNE